MCKRFFLPWSLLSPLIMSLVVSLTLLGCSSSPDSDWAESDDFFGEEDMEIVDGTGFDEGSEGGDFGGFDDFGGEDFGGDDFGGEDFAAGDDFDDFDFSDFDDFDQETGLASEVGGDDFVFEDDAFAATEQEDVTSEDALAGDPLSDDLFGTELADTQDFDEPWGDDLVATPLASTEGDELPQADNLVPLDEDFGFSVASGGDVNSQMGLVPVKKIDSMPRYRNGEMLNAVYIGRPGDTVSSVSSKIFGDDRSDEIIRHNPWLSDGISVGEKLYYQSPNRPSDNTAMLTFYEDAGVPAKTYVSGSGENIRTVSATLLGFEGAWKETWATNLHIESKDEIPDGTELVYWTEAPSAPTLASTPPAAPTPMGDDIFSFEDPMSSGTEAKADLPPPPSFEPGGFDDFGQLASEDPFADFKDPLAAQAPAPLPAEPQLPSPPPAPTHSQNLSSQQAQGTGDMMTMVLIGVLGFAALLLVVRLIKGGRKPVSMEYTQV